MKTIIAMSAYIMGLIFNSSFDNTQPATTPLPSSQPRPDTLSLLHKISLNDKEYAYIVVNPSDNAKITLHSNLDNLSPSQNLREINGCQTLVNGGFYDIDNTHIGQFKTYGREISPMLTNAMFNSFIHLEKDAVTISQTASPSAVASIQTGPLLIKARQPLTLRINNDKPSRRLVMLLDSANKYSIIAIVMTDTLNLGPYLADLPNIVQAIAQQEHIDVVAATNLDGGTHSALISGDIHMPELNPIGSFFCIK